MAQVLVTGTVTKIFWNGQALSLSEFYTSRDGESRQSQWTAWFEEPHGLDIGMTGTFKGFFSASIEDWKNDDGTPKLDYNGNPGRSIRKNINGASFTFDSNEPTESQPTPQSLVAKLDDKTREQLLIDETPF